MKAKPRSFAPRFTAKSCFVEWDLRIFLRSQKNLAMFENKNFSCFVNKKEAKLSFLILRLRREWSLRSSGGAAAPSASGGLKPFSEEKGFKNSKKTFVRFAVLKCSSAIVPRLLEILNSVLEYRLVLITVNILRNIIRKALRVSHFTEHTSVR